MNCKNQDGQRERGFSLIEMMVVVLILGVVSAGILAQIDMAQQRAFSEQIKLDNFQEARDFMDQFFRDVNQIGYPSSRMVDTTSLLWVPPLASPLINDNRMAVGLVKIDANEIRFEGDMNGDGVVQSVIYMVNGSAACAVPATQPDRQGHRGSADRPGTKLGNRSKRRDQQPDFFLL